MDAVVSVPGAEPWSAAGHGAHARLGVIVTHGFSGTPTAVRPLAGELAAAGFAVEVPLLPGHGTHYRDLATTRYGDWYGCVERVLLHLNGRVDQVVLVGHSIGATIGLDLAVRRSADVAAVVAINPQVLDRAGLAARVGPVLKYVVPFVPRELAGLAADDIARPDVAEGAYRIISTRAAESIQPELPRIREQLPGVVQPLLVVRSSRDHVVAPENSRALVGLVGSRQIDEVVCDRSYHLPQIDYDRQKVTDAVVEFVTRVAVS